MGLTNELSAVAAAHLQVLGASVLVVQIVAVVVKRIDQSRETCFSLACHTTTYACSHTSMPSRGTRPVQGRRKGISSWLLYLHPISPVVASSGSWLAQVAISRRLPARL